MDRAPSCKSRLRNHPRYNPVLHTLVLDHRKCGFSLQCHPRKLLNRNPRWTNPTTRHRQLVSGSKVDIPGNLILLSLLRGHTSMLHSSASSASPSQSRPPFSGAGLSQVLSRVLLPPPQGTLQFVHGDHSLQVPFTTTAGSKMEFPEASGHNSWQSYHTWTGPIVAFPEVHVAQARKASWQTVCASPLRSWIVATPHPGLVACPAGGRAGCPVGPHGPLPINCLNDPQHICSLLKFY